MKHTLPYFFLFFPLVAFSQLTLKAVICNSHKEPLPYTNVVSLIGSSGTSTAINGQFQLLNLRIDDTLKITNIAYTPKLVTVRSILTSDTVFLEDNINALKEIVVKPHKLHDAELGFLKSANNASFMLRPGSQLATFIQNKQADGWVKGVSFKVKDKGKCKNSMRIRLLRAAPLNLTPAEDLLTENVMIKAEDLKYNNYVDLSKYNVLMPKEGIFVVIEWVYTDVACDKNSYTVISGNMAVNNDIVWFNVRDKHWSHGARPKLPNGNYMTPNIGIKVVYPE